MASDGGDLGGISAGFLASGSAVFGAFGLWLANRLMGKAAFQSAINNGFQSLLNELQEERAEMVRQHNEERVRAAAEHAELRGEIINLVQVVESLKRILRQHGIQIPKTRVLVGGEMVTLSQEAPDEAS